MPSFEDLKIWQMAHNLMLRIDEIAVKNIPREEKFRAGDQIKRSSSSIPDNIAEGYTSYYYNDKIKCLYVARKEAGETQNHLRKLEGKGYITKEVSDELFGKYTGLIKGINGFINYIRKKRDRGKE
ncbi:MAG: four helix bundle protein [Planctomycetota bacterium]|nr:four helix bundle protein [Planctomycetota bacterium]MDI6787745.1 four helix bundle protein [Planctomycetota bacterium]